MPQVNKFKCNKCDFEMPSGWGGYIYVIDFFGARVICEHPGEGRKVLQVTGFSITEAEQKGLVGKISYCICLNCLAQFLIKMRRLAKYAVLVKSFPRNNLSETSVLNVKIVILKKCSLRFGRNMIFNHGR